MKIINNFVLKYYNDFNKVNKLRNKIFRCYSTPVCPCEEDSQKCVSEESKKMLKPERAFIVGANWKMYGTKRIIRNCLNNLEKCSWHSNTQLFLGVPAVYLDYCKCFSPQHVQIAAQNCYKAEKGAFTGEISPAMLKDIGVDWVILGHSERRHTFGETDELIAKKVSIARKFDLKVVACVGETLAERKIGKTKEVIFKQLQAIAERLDKDWTGLILAYEPVWAAGTGQISTPKVAQEVHQALREWICQNVSPEVAASISIQYGGSVTEKNCKELAAQPDIDGFLVGAASFKPEFVTIINSNN